MQHSIKVATIIVAKTHNEANILSLLALSFSLSLYTSSWRTYIAFVSMQLIFIRHFRLSHEHSNFIRISWVCTIRQGNFIENGYCQGINFNYKLSHTNTSMQLVSNEHQRTYVRTNERTNQAIRSMVATLPKRLCANQTIVRYTLHWNLFANRSVSVAIFILHKAPNKTTDKKNNEEME